MSNMVVRTNVMSLNSHRNMGMTGTMQSRASARLSSGFRINSAADDAAGLAISEKMRSQIRGLDQASRNSADGISLIQTAEGAMQTIGDMVTRIRELVVQASNDTNVHQAGRESQSDRLQIQKEIEQLIEEIDSVTLRTEFNTRTLLDGSLGSGVLGGFEAGTAHLGLSEGQARALRSFLVSNPGLGLNIHPNGQTSQRALTVDDLLATAHNGRDPFGAMEPASWNTLTAGNLGGIFKIGEPATAGLTALLTAIGAEADATVGAPEAARQAAIMNGTFHLVSGTAGATTSTTGGVNMTWQNIDRLADWLGIGTGGVTGQAATLDAVNAALKSNMSQIANAAFVPAEPAGALFGIDFGDRQNNSPDNDAASFVEWFNDVFRGPNAVAGVGSGSGGLWFQVGANVNQGITLNIESVNSTVMGINNINVSHEKGRDIQGQLDDLDVATAHVSGQRALLGAMQNRLEFTIENLDVASENLSAANSRIRDADMAREMMRFTQSNVLQQAAISMLAQANQAPQNILQLLG